jgi:hypothetical protein
MKLLSEHMAKHTENSRQDGGLPNSEESKQAVRIYNGKSVKGPEAGESIRLKKFRM